MNGQATSPSAVHAAAAKGVTVVLTVGVDDARIRRSVAIQGQPLPKGALSPDGAEGALTTSRCAGHTITYGFAAADRPGTITYHVCYGFDGASAGLVGVPPLTASNND